MNIVACGGDASTTLNCGKRWMCLFVNCKENANCDVRLCKWYVYKL